MRTRGRLSREQVVPDSYDWAPYPELPSAVLELAHLYAAHARDVKDNTNVATTFEDAAKMHHLIDLIEASSKSGKRLNVD